MAMVGGAQGVPSSHKDELLREVERLRREVALLEQQQESSNEDLLDSDE